MELLRPTFRLRGCGAAKLLACIGGKALIIPKEGWHAHTFRLHGRAMLMAMHRAALITQKRQTAPVARAVARAFRKQIDLVVERFLSKPIYFGRSAQAAKAFTGDIFLPAHEALMSEILNDVLRETGSSVTAEILPAVQSTMAQGYSKTSILLGQSASGALANPNLQRRARLLASRITGLSDTTRARFATLLHQAADEGWSVVQTTKAIVEKLPKIQANRALTIARTELNSAWTQGAVQSFKESKTITMVSVIGCESREEDRWEEPSYQPYLYRGESTCNIQDVPVGECDQLRFHVNHTGTMIPSGFIE